MAYFVYIAECSDKTFYTGYTTNIEKRIRCHNNSTTGAKYTRNRRPVILRYSEKYETKSEALKREAEIKKLPRKQKEKLVNSVGTTSVIKFKTSKCF
jgi:putative endonuclease